MVSGIPMTCRIDSPESEVCSQTGSLQDLQSVIESNGLGIRVECDRKETAVSAIGVTEAIVVRPRRAKFGVVDLFHCKIVSSDPPIEWLNIPRGDSFSIAVTFSVVELICSMRVTKSRLFRSRKTASSAQ